MRGCRGFFAFRAANRHLEIIDGLRPQRAALILDVFAAAGGDVTGVPAVRRAEARGVGRYADAVARLPEIQRLRLNLKTETDFAALHAKGFAAVLNRQVFYQKHRHFPFSLFLFLDGNPKTGHTFPTSPPHDAARRFPGGKERPVRSRGR